ncbi:hypothetical protein BSKO_12251 [Bryopsis sp. KO-2023]|nr:hypothetical protein BSKO_12251 [Bryopsis sp. KO-2023]
MALADDLLDFDLSKYRVGSLPRLYYIPDYITSDVEERLLQKTFEKKAKWVKLSGRQSQYHGGMIHGNFLIQVPLPDWLEDLTERMNEHTDIFGGNPPNHVLVNAYKPGQGIMPHEDGPLYFPGVCILSLGAPAVIRFWERCQCTNAPPLISIYLAPKSLLVFSEAAYEKCLHGIHEVEEEVIDATVANAEASGLYYGQSIARQRARISLTVRRVLKVKKNILRLMQ